MGLLVVNGSSAVQVYGMSCWQGNCVVIARHSQRPCNATECTWHDHSQAPTHPSPPPSLRWYGHVSPSMRERGLWGGGHEDRSLLRALWGGVQVQGWRYEFQVEWDKLVTGRAGEEVLLSVVEWGAGRVREC